MPSITRRGRQALAVTLSTLLGAAALAVMSSSAQATPLGDTTGYWHSTTAKQRPSKNGHQARVLPTRYEAYTLDRASLTRRLATAPDEGARTHGVVVSVPSPDGSLVNFRVKESPVMQADLAARHPEIKSYAGRGVLDPTASIRLDLTTTGFHASVRGSADTAAWHVDPAYQGDESLYVSYLGSDVPAPQQPLIEPELGAEAAKKVVKNAGEAPGAEVSLRTFRLALVTDQAYAAYFGSANVLSEKVTLINRVNQIYNDDLGVRMLLVNGTEKLNLDTDAKAIGANGPCGSAGCFTPSDLTSCSGILLNRNRVVLGQLIGASNYDIGHIALGKDGGGLAGIGVVGGDGKGRGCTGLPTPQGDFFAVDYVAHEIGHQFGAWHTFNGTEYSCGGGDSPVEPGSGSSVMAYAGICGQDDLQPHTDPYFSQRSIAEIAAGLLTSRPMVNEVQNIALQRFNVDGESFRLNIGGQNTVPIARGTTTYTLAALDAAIEAITGAGSVTVAPFAGTGSLNDTGFEVRFTGTQVRFNDQPAITVIPVSGDVAGWSGETARGGAATNGGSTVTPSGNHAPIVTVPGAKSIPIRVPFALTGSATDPDGDALVYSWEQNDEGGAFGTALGSQTKVDGPLFRMFGTYAPVTPAGSLLIGSPGQNSASTSPTRVFPDMAQILANNTNAMTGTCPAFPAPPPEGSGSNVPVPLIECASEWLPTAAYVGSDLSGNTEPSLNFRLTVRDLAPEAGGTTSGDVKLTLVDPQPATAERPNPLPFRVTSHSQVGQSVTGGTAGTVTWDVAGTDRPDLATQVRISLSVDGGKNFAYVLAESTPNNGTAQIVWPDIPTAQARVKVEAVGNYFFDVNDIDFQVVAAPPVAPDTVITGGLADQAIVLKQPMGFTYASTTTPGSFVCTLDGAALPCAASGVSWPKLPSGTHVFTVAARSPQGLLDATPARRTFTVPFDDGALKRKGKWRVRAKTRAYGGDYATSKKRGSLLRLKVRGVTEIRLIVSTGKRLGPVKVTLGKSVLRTVKTKGKKRFLVLKRVRKFDSPRSGVLKIQVAKRKAVRIEGVVVVTRR